MSTIQYGLSKNQRIMMIFLPITFIVGITICQSIYYDLFQTQESINIVSLFIFASMISILLVFFDEMGKTFQEMSG